MANVNQTYPDQLLQALAQKINSKLTEGPILQKNSREYYVEFAEHLARHILQIADNKTGDYEKDKGRSLAAEVSPHRLHEFFYFSYHNKANLKFLDACCFFVTDGVQNWEQYRHVLQQNMATTAKRPQAASKPRFRFRGKVLMVALGLSLGVVAGLLFRSPIAGPKTNPFAWGGWFTDLRDEKVYPTIIVGNNRWMAENIKYRPDSSAFWCRDEQSSDAEILFPFHVAVEVACPTGWHLATDQDWQDLETALGMDENEAGIRGWRGRNENIGLYLKSNYGWEQSSNSEPGIGKNMMGFSIVSAGTYDHSANQFNPDHGLVGSYWTSTKSNVFGNKLDDDRYAYSREFLHSEKGVRREILERRNGRSCRCVANQATK